MRTTLTLDDDVAAALERLRKQRDASYRDVVNEVMRLGLRQAFEVREPPAPYVQRTYDVGACRLPNVDNIAEVLDLLEGEGRRL